MINNSTLDGLSDDELRGVITQSESLLKRRDEERKSRALTDARALLESVGLSLKDLNGKGRARPHKGPTYKAGRAYQHPTDKALVWNANGQKPNWLRELEAGGGKAVQVAAANDNGAAASPKARSIG